jgi:hypothetical protein
LDYAEGIIILQVKSAMQMKLQFFQQASQLYCKFQSEKQVAMKTTGYGKLCAPVILCRNANENKLLPYINNEQRDRAKRTFLQRCNSPGLNKCMDDIAVNARMAWMCVEISATFPTESETG